MSKLYYCFVLMCCLCLASCGAAASPPEPIPTLAVLPSVTPQPTPTPTPTVLPTVTPIPTLTPDLVGTQVAALEATNAVAQITMDALLTRVAPSPTLEATLTPSLTITSTLPASTLPPQAVPMQPRLIYAQSAANLRPCPNRTCDPVAQLQTGEAVMATGTIQGEAMTSGNPHWFQVEYGGQVLYVYTDLVNVTPPTQAPVSIPPTTGSSSIVETVSYDDGCPSMSATCGELTCEQAYACLAAGNGRLDADDDGIPCESVCGN
jgi:hypothetical protein